jgi:hypothetical protein
MLRDTLRKRGANHPESEAENLKEFGLKTSHKRARMWYYTKPVNQWKGRGEIGKNLSKIMREA